MPTNKTKSPIAENGRLIQIYLFIILDLTYNATIAKTVNSILEVQYGLDDIIHQALTVHIFVADIEPHTSLRQGNHNLGAILLDANLGLEPRLFELLRNESASSDGINLGNASLLQIPLLNRPCPFHQ